MPTDTASALSQQSGLKAWKPGESGNPAGRQKGSRNKLGEAFLEDMLTDWGQHGKAVIEAVRADKPDQYLKVVASILPRELNVKVGDLDELTDDQLHRQYAAIAKALVDSGFGNSAGVAAPESPEQAGGLSTLQ